MWKLSEIKIKNIISFREAMFTVEQGVATLIFGKNEDNTSQPCNGSGKSSLIEAISFALTGEQLRKVKSVEEIINDHEESAYVYLKLFNDYNNTTFTIERIISRDAPQSIECHKYDESGKEIECDKTVQPTVLDYNKFVLNEIGLTKDDIYSNFILCDNKYESFFDCSDKSKKEVINRFSNGVIVDESIDKVLADMEPVKDELTEANNKVINIKGSIYAIENELSLADKKKTDALNERQSRINKLDEQIQKCRNDIETIENNKQKASERLEILNQVLNEVSELEDSDMALIDSYNIIKKLCEENDLDKITEYDALSEQYKEQLLSKQGKIKDTESLLSKAEQSAKELFDKYQDQLNIYNESCVNEEDYISKDEKLKESINKELDKIDIQLDKIESEIKSLKKHSDELELYVSRNKALLNGAIVCPKCEHKFFLNNSNTVDDIKAEIDKLNKDLKNNAQSIKKLDKQFVDIDAKAEEKEKKIDEINQSIKSRKKLIEERYKNVVDLKMEVDKVSMLISMHKRDLTSYQSELDVINGKIDVLRNKMFSEITNALEGRIMNGYNYVDQQDSSVNFLTGQMKQYQQSKKELLEAPVTDFEFSLKKSLKTYKSSLKQAENESEVLQKQYDSLKEQELNFTMFKSYLAKKKIDALSLIVNDFLEKIGSDIRLKLEGFTITKTGKLRDKISVQVMRDGVDCGSYHKFSGGEKARLNLACILSLHTLTNSNCEDGKGLDFIIIDELLDKSDEMGMSTYCDALNKLGQTALLITQGNVAESYPHKLLIVKKQGISTIQNQ